MRSPRLRASPAVQEPPRPLTAEAETRLDHQASSSDADSTLLVFDAGDEPPPPYEHAADRCVVLPHRTAQWRVKGNEHLLLSTLAATVLVSERQLDGGNVELLQAGQKADRSPTDPVSSIAISTYSTINEVVLGIAAGPREAYRQVVKAKEGQKIREAEEYQPLDDDPPGDCGAPGASDATSTLACPTPLSGSGSNTLRAGSDAGAAKGATENPYAAVALSSGKGVARIVGAGLKAPGVYTHGLSRGFNNVPRWYGDETVRKEEKVDGVVTGLAAAGKGLGYGLYDGITGFFVQPVKGAQKEGPVGFLKGFGKGLGGIVCKPAAGACGVPGYAFTGIQKSIEKQLSRKASTEECLAAEEVLRGEEEMRKLSDIERTEIVSAWLARTTNS